MGDPSDVQANAPGGAATDMWDWLSERESDTQPSVTTAEEIDQLIRRIKQKQSEFHRSRTKYVDNIVKWLHKLKDIGEIVPSFDPIHAALTLLASTPRFLSAGRVHNAGSTQEPIHSGDAQDRLDLKRQYLDKLHNELTSFYSKSMSLLQLWYSNLLRNQVRQKMAAVLNLSEQVDILSELEAQRKQVIECGETCERVLNHKTSDRSRFAPKEPINEVPQVPLRIDKREQVRLPAELSDLEEIKRKRVEDTRGWILRKKKRIEPKEGNSRVTVLYGDRICVLHFCALVRHATADSNKLFLTSKVVGYSTHDGMGNKAAAFFYCKGKSSRRRPQYILGCVLRQLSSSGHDLIHPATQGLPRQVAAQGFALNALTCQDFMGRLIRLIYLSQRPSQRRRLCKHHRSSSNPQWASPPTRSCDFRFEAPLLKIISTFGLLPLLRSWGREAGVEFGLCDLSGLSILLLVIEYRRESAKLFLTAKKSRTDFDSLSPMATTIEAFFRAVFNNFTKGGTHLNLSHIGGRTAAFSAASALCYHVEISGNFSQAGAGIDEKNQLFFKRRINTHVPLHHSVGVLNPMVCINKAGHEITKACILRQADHSYYFPSSWFYIMWELQTSSASGAHPFSQLQQWGFPGTLPSRLTLVAKLTSISGCQRNSFLIISIQDSHVQLGIVPARQTNQQRPKRQIENTKWRRCISRSIGVANIADDTAPTPEVDPLDAEVAAALKRTEVYGDSQYNIPVSWSLMAFGVALLAWIFGL